MILRDNQLVYSNNTLFIVNFNAYVFLAIVQSVFS